MKSAIGEGMTRVDHADVSNQLVRRDLVESSRRHLSLSLSLFRVSMRTTPLAKTLPR